MVKVPCPCMVCQKRFNQPCGHIVLGTPTEKNAIEVFCPHSGGSTFVVNQGFHYELWAEESLIKFFERDFALSVSSISTALERFNEIFVKWSLFRTGLERPAVELTWKEISKYSERQMGAVSIARAIVRLDASVNLPALPATKLAQLRNDVVHGGYFPSQKEAEAHATEALKYIFAAIRIMKESDESLQKLVLWELSNGHVHAHSEIKTRGLDEGNCAVSTLSFPYRLALHNNFDEVNFSELVDTAAKVNKLKHA